MYAIQQFDTDTGGQDAALPYENQNGDHVHQQISLLLIHHQNKEPLFLELDRNLMLQVGYGI